MKIFLKSFVLMLMLCVQANADIILSYEFYDVGTTDMLDQPIMPGDMFDMAIIATDTVGTGLNAASLDFLFDNSLLTQTGPLTVAFNNDFGSALNATGGTVFGASTSGPVSEVARVKYTADAAGVANFSMSGNDQGNAGFAAFGTEDTRTFLADGSCDPNSNLDCTGEVVNFGTGSVTIVPEPAAALMLLTGLLGMIRRF